MSNPYSAPNAPINDVGFGNETYEPRFFSVDGRIGRIRYLAFSVLLGLLAWAAIFAAVLVVGGGMTFGGDSGVGMTLLGGLVMIVIYIATIVGSVILMRRRLNDLDKSGWWIFLMLVPVVNLFFALYLVFAAGTQSTNRFGPKPNKTPTLYWVLGLIGPVLFTIGIIAAIAIPAYHDYTKRAEAAQVESQYSED